MTPILFAANETAFTSNGIGRLTDAVSCLVTEERNGQYELVMQYPIDGEMFGEIACGKYIFATHDESKTPQAFQIYRISAPLEGVVTINAWHISYALNTIIVEPFTAGSCTAAIAGVKTHSMNTNPFTFSTDKQVTADFELTIPASARAVLGGMSGSILDVYGKGEYEFDMYAVKLYLNRGQNRGVSIRYGKNLAKLDQTLDASNVYNSVVPYWTNGETTVVSDAIITRTGESVGNTISLDLSTYFMDEPTVAELKAKAQTIVDASEDYTLKENVKVDFVALWQTEEYKNYAALERVFLCDTVNIFYEKLGVNVTAKVIKVVYDTLRERYASIELGEPTTSLYQQIQTSVVNDVMEVVPSKSQMQSAIDHATELIGGGFGGYIKFNYLSDGTPSEMLVMDSPDESTAVNIIRLNQNGLGFSTDGGSTYANAWTIDGNLNASFITTGVLDADLMTAGMIQDASGKNYWNLDTGQFATQQGQIADFDIHTDELLGGNYGFNNTGTRIKRGSFSTTYTQAYTVGGQLQIYTHFNSYGSEVSFYITDPSRTTYPLLSTELAGRIVPNYNATLDFRELKLYGGSNEMIDLRATSNPYIYVNKRMQIGASTNMLVNNLFGSLQIRKDTGTDGTYLSGKGAAFGKSAITDNLVDSAWDIKTAGTIKTSADGHIGASSSPTLMLECPIGTRWADYAARTVATNGVQRLSQAFVRAWSYNSSTGARTGYYEEYRFPDVTANRSGNDAYSILTTKDYVRDTSSMTGIHLQKCNNVVQISCRGCSVNSSGSFGTLPTGFRPMGYMYATGFITYQGGDKPCNIVIEADGTTKVYYFNGTSTAVATGGTLYANIVFLSW